MNFFSWLSSVVSVGSVAPKKAAPTPAVTVGGVAITMGQVVSAVKALPSAREVRSANLVHGKAHPPGRLRDEIGLDALAAAAVIDPALAPDIALIGAIAPFLIQGIASGVIKGDTDPIHDAQTTREFNPGDPAARL